MILFEKSDWNRRQLLDSKVHKKIHKLLNRVQWGGAIRDHLVAEVGSTALVNLRAVPIEASSCHLTYHL